MLSLSQCYPLQIRNVASQYFSKAVGLHLFSLFYQNCIFQYIALLLQNATWNGPIFISGIANKNLKTKTSNRHNIKSQKMVTKVGILTREVRFIQVIKNIFGVHELDLMR